MENDARPLDQKTQAELRRSAHLLHKKENPIRKLLTLLGFTSKPLTAGGLALGATALPHCALKSAGARKGCERTLTSKQEKKIQNKITEKIPDQLKMTFALYRRRAVCELIKQEYGFSMPIHTCGEYLKRWGFTP
jgi:hypothetical protein